MQYLGQLKKHSGERQLGVLHKQQLTFVNEQDDIL